MTNVSIDWQHSFSDSKPNSNAANFSIIPVYPQAGGIGPGGAPDLGLDNS
ncbi:MAG TPA: hypothetical protein PKE64_15600 [Anaerolineae bacterium]|nr:hypothetical protein [Anaerolineae bacterium]